MLLNIKNDEDRAKISQYGKAKGMVLLDKYLPDINIFESLYVVSSKEDIEKLLLKDFNPMFCVRADSQIGQKPTHVRGQTLYNKSDLLPYFIEIKNNNPDGVLVYADMKEGSGERVKADGGFNTLFDIGNKLYIDCVGKCFDSRECTQGKASHETFVIPWQDIYLLDAKNFNDYRVQIISDEAYIQTVEERQNWLIASGYDAKLVKEIMPKSYQPLSLFWKRKLLNDVILPLLAKEKELLEDGLKVFGIQGNFVGQNIIPIEMNRPERF